MNKKVAALVVGLVVLIAAAALVYTQFAPSGNQDAKDITVEVVFADGESNTHEIQTEEEFLRGALEQESLVEGTDSEYGLYIMTVDGVTADEAEEQWWSVTVNGEMAETGVDSIALEDGASYEITLVTGW